MVESRRLHCESLSICWYANVMKSIDDSLSGIHAWFKGYSAQEHQNSKKTMTPKQYQCHNSRINSIYLHEEIAEMWASQRQTVHFIRIEWVKSPTLSTFIHRVMNVGENSHTLCQVCEWNVRELENMVARFQWLGKLLKCGEYAHTHAIHGVPLHYDEMMAMMFVRWQYLQKCFQSMSLIPTHIRTTTAAYTHMEISKIVAANCLLGS